MRAEEEAPSRGTDNSVHTQSPARRNRCRGRAGIASARAGSSLGILPLSTYFFAALKLRVENQKNFLWYVKLN